MNSLQQIVQCTYNHHWSSRSLGEAPLALTCETVGGSSASFADVADSQSAKLDGARSDGPTDIVTADNLSLRRVSNYCASSATVGDPFKRMVNSVHEVGTVPN